jgi:ElaB/YqjD/DUF883 family membrane-anchored ribosome-binding protein
MEPMQTGRVPSSVEEMPAGDTLQATRDRLNETWNGVNRRAREAAQYTNEAVHNNPWTSIGVGFGAGVVIGALIALAASSSRSFR